MTNEDLQQALRELEERIDGMEIDLTPPEDAMSNFTVFENEAGDRQMIVHFIDVADYEVDLPKSREEARAVFLKVIKEHQNHQNRAITHGDLMVLNCQPCNYYCYVAKVDKTGGTGFQAEDKLDPPAAITDQRGERILHELVIWTETYPNDGGSSPISSSLINITDGDTNTFKVTELYLEEPEPCPEVTVIPDMWDVLVEYNIGDEVEYNGKYYKSRSVNDASPPGEGLGGEFPDWIEIDEEDLTKKEDCPNQVELTIPKVKIVDSDDSETNANFKARSLDIVVTPGTAKTIEHYTPNTTIVDLDCDKVLTPIIPALYTGSIRYEAGDYVSYAGKYYRAKEVTIDDPPDDPIGEEYWEEVDEADLPQDTQDPCVFGTAKIDIEQQADINGPQEFKSYNIDTTPGNFVKDGAPFNMPTVTVSIGNTGTPQPFDMYAITLAPCDPVPPPDWDSNTLYNGGEIVGYNGKFYQASDISQGNFPDDANNADLWTEIPEEDAQQPDPECEFDETFNFAAPQLKDTDTKSPINVVTGLQLEAKCKYVDDGYVELLSKSDLAETAEEFAGGTVDSSTLRFLTSLTKKDQKDGDQENDGSPQNIITGINSLAFSNGDFTSSGSPKNVVSEISNIEIDSGTPTPDGEFEVVISESQGSPDITNTPVFETSTGSDCGGCFVVKQTGQLKITKETFKETKKVYEVVETPSTLKINGKTIPLEPGYIPTTVSAAYATVDAQGKKKPSQLTLEAGTAYYSPITGTKELVLSGEKERVTVTNSTNQFKVKGTTKDIVQVDKVYEYKGKQLYIKGSKQFLNATKSTVTFTSLDYNIVVSDNKKQLYKRTDTIYFNNGNKLTLTPYLTKIVLDYQRMYKLDRSSVYIGWTGHKKKLTPEEANITLSEEYDVTIKNEDIKEIHFEELKKLKLIPKTYTLKKYLHDLEFTAKNLSVSTTSASLESTECQTVKVETGPTSNNDFQLQSGTVNLSETPVEDDLNTLEIEDEGTEPGVIFKSSKLEATSEYTKPADTKKINGTKVEDDTPPTPPTPLNRNVADVINTETKPKDEYEINHVDVELEPLDDDYITIESFKLEDETGGGSTPYPIQSSSVNVGSPVPQAAQRMDLLEVEYDDDPNGDLGDVTSTQLTTNDGTSIDTGYIDGCTSSKVAIEDGTDPEDATVTIVDRHAAVGLDEEKKEITVDIDIQSLSFENPGTTTDSDITGPNITGITIGAESATKELANTSGPTFKTIQLKNAGAEKTITKATTEFVESDPSSVDLFIPQLSKCPVNNDTIHVLDDDATGSSTVSINSTANILCLKTQIPFKNYTIDCGVLSGAGDTANYSFNHCFNLQPYWMHTLQVCNASGQPDNITVMTTTDPSVDGNKVTPAGYTILSGSST
jgi:hypothetical protein